MAPLKDFTDILSGEAYVTVSTVKPVVHHLTTVVLMSSEDLIKDIEKGVSAYIREKYSSVEVNDLLDAATFMDSRFRTGYIDDIDRDGVIQRITEEATEIAKSSQTHSNPTEQSEQQKDSQTTEDHTQDTESDTHPPYVKKLKLGDRVKLGKF